MQDKPSKIKKEIMLKLCEDRRIFELLNNGEVKIEYKDDLIGKSIFPYLKIDYTQEQSGTYICLGINFPSISENQILKISEITFLVVSNNNNNLVNKGNDTGFVRTDLIVEQILTLFNWNDLFGFDLKLNSDIEGTLNENFYYREAIFKSLTTNSMVNGTRVNQWAN